MVLLRSLTRKINRTLLCRMSTNTSPVLLEDIGNKGVITLNKPKVLNSLDLDMVRVIYPKLKQWEKEKSLVIIKGAGEKAFCAGGDIVAVTNACKRKEPLMRDFFYEEYKLNCLIGTLHIPFVALINGITMGGGVGLSVHGPFRVGTEKSLFAMPETAIGLFPDVGGSFFLPRLGGHLGLYLALTGHRLRGWDVYKAGIATHMCNFNDLRNLENALLGLNSPTFDDISVVLQKFHNSSDFDKQQEFSLKPHMQNINKYFGEACIEDIIVCLEKDGSNWAKKILKDFEMFSPTSMKVTHEQLKRGEKLSFQECFTMEYRIVSRIVLETDFIEGVRALLIDKDLSPKWNPPKLADVTTDIVQKHFEPLLDTEELKL